MDRYASHLPVLRAFLPMWEDQFVLEFGCGEYSTPLLNEYAFATSIEQDCEAFAITQCANGHDVRFMPWHSVGLKEMDALNNGNYCNHYGLIFVDGCDEARKDCVEWAFGHTSLIIAHDAENPYYGYQLISTPVGWIRLTVPGAHVWPGCAVWMKSKETE